MATQAGNSVDHLNPHVVGNAFAQEYYRILTRSPEHVNKLYHDESFLGRPDCDGYQKVLFIYKPQGLSVQIDNVDTQTSHGGGLLVLVAGSFIMPDIVKRRFTQSFFLAPQETGGYFVKNDALRYTTAEPEPPSVKEITDPELPFSDYVFL